MPLKFTKDQIRRYLREMGYNDLTDEHLDLFIRDLKKLIKHEEKKRHARKAHFLDDPVESVSESSANTSFSPDTADADGIDHSGTVGTGRREPPTDTSTSYNSPPRSAVKSQTKKSQEQSPRPVTVPVAPKPAPTTTTRISIVPGKSPVIPASASTAVVPTARRDRQPDPVEDLSSDSSSLETSSSSSGPDSLSRPSQKSKYTGRMDPVARYHYYKKLWDKQKAPGEDRHMQLRWNVRAGTMGKVPCDPLGIRVKYLR